jgi:hypothetical protein
MQRIIIVTNSAIRTQITAYDRDLITGFLQGKGWHVWHWYEDLWLAVTDSDDPVLKTVRDELGGLLPQHVEFIIMEFKEEAFFAGAFPLAGIPWLKIHWK